MNQKLAILNKPGIFILASGFIALIVVVIIFNRLPFYDEVPYLENVATIHKFGFSKEYLLNLVGSAGPLYSTVHFLLEDLTHLNTPAIRFVNILFLCGVIFFTARTLQLLKFSDGLYALTIMAIPMSYVVGGLALTEVPAMFFMAAGIYLLLKSLDENATSAKAAINAMVAGICISLAIAGRQPYLLILAALPVFFYSKKKQKKSIALLVITLSFSLALPCYVFLVWHGLVAPADALFYANIARQGISYRPELFLLCLAYYAIILFIIAPGFYIIPKKWGIVAIILAFIVIAIINDKFDLIRFLPLKAYFITILSSYNLYDFAEKLFGSALAVTGSYFLIILAWKLHKASYKKELLFYALATVAIAFSCIKLTHGFSSRYAAQAIPLLVPLGSYFCSRTAYLNMRLILGVLLGILSLLSFFLS